MSHKWQQKSCRFAAHCVNRVKFRSLCVSISPFRLDRVILMLPTGICKQVLTLNSCLLHIYGPPYAGTAIRLQQKGFNFFYVLICLSFCSNSKSLMVSASCQFFSLRPLHWCAYSILSSFVAWSQIIHTILNISGNSALYRYRVKSHMRLTPEHEVSQISKGLIIGQVHDLSDVMTSNL